MEKKYNQIKKLFLLTLLPLLSGTEGVVSALVFSGVLIIIALFVRIIALLVKDSFDKKPKWIFLWGIGFSLANFLYIILPGIFSISYQYINFYILLIGVSPIVYANCTEGAWYKFIKEMLQILFLMLVIGLSREFFGQGNILNYSILENPPLEILSDPSGAFLMLGFTALILEFIFKNTKISKSGINHFNKSKEGGLSSE